MMQSHSYGLIYRVDGPESYYTMSMSIQALGVSRGFLPGKPKQTYKNECKEWSRV